MDELYIENYSNTEFVSEAPAYEYLLHFSDFLRKYKENNIPFDNVKYKNFDPYNLLGIWHEYMINMIIELFNNFIYGNLICATAMTRTLIESYVYLSILIKEKNQKLLEDWFLCSVIRKIPRQTEEKDTEYYRVLDNYCKKYGRNREEVYQKFFNKNENSWLSEIISGKRITFRDACDYLGKPEIYSDFQKTSSFIHGQDIVSKMMPFTFYVSIYNTLAMMIIYIGNVLRLFSQGEILNQELDILEIELMELAEKMKLFTTEDTP